MEVVQFVPQLGKALWNLKVMYDQHVENGNEIKELQSFIQDYDHHIPILRERFQEGGGNVMGIAAFKSLEKDVTEATNKLEGWSRNKSFFRLFNSAERMQKLGKLHFKVMASVQKSLGIANLSVLLDLQATQAIVLESNAELKFLLITSIGSMHGMLRAEVRDEIVEASTSSFADPKFWEDVLAAVDNHNLGVLSLDEKDVYEDPITTNLMIDPVVASDGNTYCRWTIIDNNWTTNPFNVKEDLTIVIDNLTFRRGLFEKFPEQAHIFRQRRNQYQSHALSLKAKGLLGDAVLALHYVLQWDKHDVECVEALKQVQGALQEGKEKYLQPCVGPSNEPGNGGPIGLGMHEIAVGPCIFLHEAYQLFPSLSSSIPEVRQRAAHGICQWSKRDAKFQSYIVKKGGIPLLATLLPSSDPFTQELVVSILLDVMPSSLKRRSMFGLVNSGFPATLVYIVEVLKVGSTNAREQVARILFNLSTSLDRRSVIGNSEAMHALVITHGDGTPEVQRIVSDTLNNLFPDALVYIVEVLKDGSTTAREQAVRILFNFSLSPDRTSVIGKSGAMHALVTLLGNKDLEVQQIVSSTLHNLFHTFSNRKRAIKAGLVPILVRLIAEQRATMLEEALPLMNQSLHPSYQPPYQPFQCASYRMIPSQYRSCICMCRRVIRGHASASMWSKIMASESLLNRERATSILFTLCYDDWEYRRNCLDQLVSLIRLSPPHSESDSEVNASINRQGWSGGSMRDSRGIQFPMKTDWWSPQRD